MAGTSTTGRQPATAGPSTSGGPMYETVRAVQHEFDQAELHGDMERLRRLIADDFLSIGPKGFVLNKEQWIGRHNQFKYHALETSEMDIRLYDKTAIVRDVQQNRATYQNDEVNLTVRVSQVWVQQADGQWRIVAIQFSPMAQG